MKMQIRLQVAVAFACLLVATPAWSGAPGSAGRAAALPNTCHGGPLSGRACDPTDADPCGARRDGRAFECVVDLRGLPSLSGRLTLIADEEVGDNGAAGGNPTITMLLEIKGGQNTWRFAESFQAVATGAWPLIGPWIPMSEADVKSVTSSFQSSSGALEGLGYALREAGEAILGTPLGDAVPVIAALVPEPAPTHVVDQVQTANLGQVATYRVEIRFVAP